MHVKMPRLRSKTTLILSIVVMIVTAAYLTFPWHYQVPFQHCEVDGYELVPDTYTVILRHHHTIPEHQNAIGMPTLKQDHIARTISSLKYGTKTYFTKPISKAVLRRIRADKNVAHVSCTRLMRGNWYSKSGVDDGGKVYFDHEQARLSGLKLDKAFARDFMEEHYRQNWRFVKAAGPDYNHPEIGGLLGGASVEQQLDVVSGRLECVRQCLKP